MEKTNNNFNFFTSHEAAEYLGITYYQLKELVRKGKLTPDFRGNRRRPNLFSVTTLNAYRDGTERKITTPEPVTANPEPATEYVSPIDVLIHIDKTINEDPNVKAYYDMKNCFEQMNEAALQKLFSPMLERFKFAYICKCVPEIQSQMLTCINKGKLRGMEKYGMDFNAFLKLVKFAHDNYVPLDAIDNQGEGVNA